MSEEKLYAIALLVICFATGLMLIIAGGITAH